MSPPIVHVTGVGWIGSKHGWPVILAHLKRPAPKWMPKPVSYLMRPIEPFVEMKR